MSGMIKLELWDEDKINDEMGGSLILRYKDLLALPSGTIQWMHIYGCPGQEGMTQ